MTANLGHRGKTTSVPGGLAMGAAVSMAVTLALTAVIALFLNNGKITWGQAGYWIMGMLFAASYLGGKCACGAIRRQRLIVALMSGVLYWALLMCMTALFFGGSYEAVWETAGLIGAGCGTAALTFSPFHLKTGRKKGRGNR